MIALCEAGCKRPATKGSGGRWCYWDDPAVEASAKLQARQLGGRRGVMGPAEAASFFDDLDPTSTESRQAFRLRLMERFSAGRLTGAMYRDLLDGLDRMGKDHGRAPKGKPAPAPLHVVVQK